MGWNQGDLMVTSDGAPLVASPARLASYVFAAEGTQHVFYNSVHERSSGREFLPDDFVLIFLHKTFGRRGRGSVPRSRLTGSWRNRSSVLARAGEAVVGDAGAATPHPGTVGGTRKAAGDATVTAPSACRLGV
jgi:hypothetical protein